MIQIIKSPWQGPERVKIAKLILQHPLATLSGNVDKYLAEAVRFYWPEMCQMLIVDASADARTKEHCLKDRPPWITCQADEKVLDAITACLSEEVLQAITAAPETGNVKGVKRKRRGAN